MSEPVRRTTREHVLSIGAPLRLLLHQPENWDQDTRFDGREHWGMDPRWKDLFPKRGTRLVSDDSSRNDSSGSEESDGGEAICAKGTKLTVDITQDDDEDNDAGYHSSSGWNSDGDGGGRDATCTRLDLSRRRIPETAPPAFPLMLGKNSSRSKNATATTGGSSSGSKRKERRDEAHFAARMWRQGNRITDPASSSRVRVGHSGESCIHSNAFC